LVFIQKGTFIKLFDPACRRAVFILNRSFGPSFLYRSGVCYFAGRLKLLVAPVQRTGKMSGNDCGLKELEV